ncbi:signal peptide protein [Rhodopirellula sallentina SM41]|uniref:Signal peptide protein n=1 Tax=Rhodopirellula sallentina SM41 TaxID=1263870 RepID=M5U615_9BACT|nr:signal peptide protein [Rhodopirellula sallentina SM41]
MLRLHAKGRPDQPLIGYEIYDKELDSKSMTFVGRTDWNGRLTVGKIDRPLRLLYVKNGGAVLARLPMVPGHHEVTVADLAGDDMRLQAEAYIRGVQNAIIDLVAVRELFKARISMRIKEGKLKEADELLEMLRNEPSNEKIANDMGKKQTLFLKAIGRNANQQRKVDEMFSVTRELLSKHINPKIVNDLETALIEANKRSGGAPAEAETPSDEESPPAE